MLWLFLVFLSAGGKAGIIKFLLLIRGSRRPVEVEFYICFLYIGTDPRHRSAYTMMISRF